jgi:hypothetical protein
MCRKCDCTDREICALCGDPGREYLVIELWAREYKATEHWEIVIKTPNQALIKVIARSLHDAGDKITVSVVQDIANDHNPNAYFSKEHITLCLNELVYLGVLI